VNGERLMFLGNFLVFDMSKIVYWYAIGLHGGKSYGRKTRHRPGWTGSAYDVCDTFYFT
jgi:hypothetical protein